MRVAYVIGRYPAVSHTFILREVRAMRANGVAVETFSVYRSKPDDLLSPVDRAEFETTYSLFPFRPGDLVAAHLGALAGRPAAYLRTLAVALSLRPGGSRGVVRQLFHFATAVTLWRHGARKGISHLHAHLPNVAADVALLAAHLGGPGWSWSLTLHGPPKSRSELSTLPRKLPRAALIVCVSDFARSQVMGSLEKDRRPKIEVVHCGVDTALFEPTQVPADEGPVRILTVGRLIPLKGQRILLHALGELVHRRGVDASLLVVGDGPERGALERLARELGIADRVRFAGAVGQDRIRAHYAAADVFCLPSLIEGIPVVLMEAMAMGLAVVATRIMGVPELVEHGTSGLLVAPGSADELAAALAELADAPERRAAMGSAGRAKVREEFELDTVVRRLRGLISAASSPAPAPSGP